MSDDIKTVHGIGDQPVEPEYLERMKQVARYVDRILNTGEDGRKVGFCLMVFPFEGGRCNYLSNGSREDVMIMLKEQLDNFEREQAARQH